MANALRRPPLPFPRHVDEIVDLCRRLSTSSHLTMTGLLVLELSQRWALSAINIAVINDKGALETTITLEEFFRVAKN